MAIGKNITFLANGFNLACALKSFTPEATVEELDATVLCNDYRSYVPGFKNGTLSAEGIWNSDTENADEIHDVLSAAFTSGSNLIVTASMETVAIGADAIMLDGPEVKYGIPINTGELIMATAELRSTNGINFGKWLMSELVVEGTETNASIDNAAATTNGGLAHFHVHSEDEVEVTVKVQHSTNNSVWVDLATGSFVDITGHEAQSVTVTGSVSRYLRAIASVTAGDTILVSAAFARR